MHANSAPNSQPSQSSSNPSRIPPPSSHTHTQLHTSTHTQTPARAHTCTLATVPLVDLSTWKTHSSPSSTAAFCMVAAEAAAAGEA
eukprot:364347-Chlamydomonas_euryale.AAC.23